LLVVLALAVVASSVVLNGGLFVRVVDIAVVSSAEGTVVAYGGRLNKVVVAAVVFVNSVVATVVLNDGRLVLACVVELNGGLIDVLVVELAGGCVVSSFVVW
jgi:hypothetical protein